MNKKNVNEEEKDLKKELENTKQQLEEYLNGWKRAKADLVNFQKEIEKQKEEWFKFANKNLIISLLPLRDNFSEALKYAPAERNNFLEGIEQIKKQLDNLLKEFGVEKMEVIGEKFNPELHESVQIEESDQEQGVIIKEIQAGYKLNGKILRPPKVVIGK